MSTSASKALLAAALLGLSSSAAHASFFDTYGFSPRAIGRGNGMVALGSDYDAAYYNPANILARKRVHLGFGFNYVLPALDIEALQGDFDTILPDSNLAMHLGFSTPIGGIFNEKIGFGFAFFHPLTTGTNVSSVEPSQPWFYRYDRLPDKLILAAAFAVEPIEWLRLGLGVQVLAGIDGRVETSLSAAEGRFLSEYIDIEVVPRISPTLGLALGPFHGWRFGATYRHELKLDYTLPVAIEIEQVGLIDVLIEGVSLYTPSQLALALGWESAPAPLPGWSIEAGLTLELWSKAPPAGARFYLDIDDSGIRPENPETVLDIYADLIPLGAVDTLTPHLGMEWRPSAMWALRGGYRFRPTPLPLPVYQTNTLDADAHILSLGAGVLLGDPFTDTGTPVGIDMALQWTYLPGRMVTKDLEAGSPQGAYYASGSIWQFTVSLRHDYF